MPDLKPEMIPSDEAGVERCASQIWMERCHNALDRLKIATEALNRIATFEGQNEPIVGCAFDARIARRALAEIGEE